MSSKKCLACGLTNFATDEVCKKCGSELKNQKLSTACPRCSSDNTQSFEMAYQSGTNFGAMVGVTPGGHIGVAGGKTQSVLAKNLKPPAADEGVGERVAIIILLIVAFNFVGGALMVLVDPWIGLFAAIILTIAVAAFFAIKGGRNKEEKKLQFHKAMQRWRRKWICLKCGNDWLAHQ